MKEWEVSLTMWSLLCLVSGEGVGSLLDFMGFGTCLVLGGENTVPVTLGN